MNILILTPLYKISGRESLERNTEVIHHFAKYWVNEPDVNVQVVNTYLNPGRNLLFLLKKGELKKYFTPFDYEVDGIKVHLVEVQQIPFQNKFWKFQNKTICKAIEDVTKTFKPDVILAHFPVRYTGVIDSVCGNVPKIAVMHYTDLWISQKHMYQVESIGSKFDVTFTRSKSLLEESKKLGIKNLSDFIVYSGVPYAESRRSADIAFSKDKPVKLLYVGKLIERKHLDYVIKAMGQLKWKKNLMLTVVGEGPEKQRFEELSKKYGIEGQVRFIGKLTREEVYRAMDDADIFIMPSVEETLGLVYLEAMMNGCLTVGTKGEGIDGIIEDGKNGFLVDPGSEKSVVETLQRILRLPNDEIQQISLAATETGKVFNEPDMAKRYLNKIRQLVREKGGNA